MPRSSTSGARWAVGVCLALILLATLWPGTPRWTPLRPWCLLCGERDGADAVLNVVLFLPLGLALAFNSLRPPAIVLMAAILSTAIELAQVIIPGRDPSVRDVLMNTIGAAAGASLDRTVDWWLPSSRRLALQLCVAAGVSALAVIVVTSLLLRPSYTRDLYYAQWTQEREHGEIYGGRVLSATVDSVPLPAGPLPRSDAIRRLLKAGAIIQVTVLAGPPVSTFAPIFAITDAHAREELTIAATSSDLVFRFRTASAGLRLDQPDIRMRGVMPRIPAGDTLRLSVSRSDRGWCLTMNTMEQCAFGLTVASGWRILFAGDGLPPWFRTVVSSFWIAAFAFPIGLWGGRSWASVVGAALFALGLGVMPVLSGLDPTPVIAWLAGILGISLGMIVGARLRPVANPAEYVAP